MLIDWFTVGAQTLNFLVLVWLLRHFLYRPILDALDAREKFIADELEDARTKRAAAEKERSELEAKSTDFENRSAALWNDATAKAKAEMQRLQEEAKKTADNLAVKRAAAAVDEERQWGQGIAERTQRAVFSISRQALTDLGSAKLEEQIVEVFVQRLGDLSGDSKAALVKAIADLPGETTVRSAFEIPETARAAIESALKAGFAREVPVHYMVAPELIGGVEFVAGGQKVAWNLSQYLKSLQGKVELQSKDDARAQPLVSAPTTHAPDSVKERSVDSKNLEAAS